MEARKENELHPIFIVGVPRSGSTLLRVILDSHPKIAAAPETPWILGGYGDYSLRDIAVYLTQDKVGPVKNFIGEDEEVVLAGIRAMLRTIFADYLRRGQKEILVLKTPDDIRHIDFLMQLYPNSKYIHIFRDGRDVACSTMNKKGFLLGRKIIDYGEMNYRNVIRRWADWERRLRSIFDGDDKISCIRISYEELITYPEETMKKVCHGIGVSYESGMLDYAKYDHTYPEWEAGSIDVKNRAGIDTHSVGRWKKEMNRSDLAKIEAAYGDLLETLGYRLGTDFEERAKAAEAAEGRGETLPRDRGTGTRAGTLTRKEKVRELERRLRKSEKELRRKDEELRNLSSSLSWRFTAPFRTLIGVFRRHKERPIPGEPAEDRF